MKPFPHHTLERLTDRVSQNYPSPTTPAITALWRDVMEEGWDFRKLSEEELEEFCVYIVQDRPCDSVCHNRAQASLPRNLTLRPSVICPNLKSQAGKNTKQDEMIQWMEDNEMIQWMEDNLPEIAIDCQRAQNVIKPF
ncbi:hypothetical protein Btru_077015 [Bulinus truncatus]|nr:hypothetical protein Btru_077015 [Bulinus truncatus]